GASVTERTTSWPLLYKPGSRYRYANNDTLLAVHAARLDDFMPFEFFMKLGMTRTYAETDWQGSYILSSQVWTTARDLGRLGLLYLDNGVWAHGKAGPERILPENWRTYVSTPSGPQPDRQFGYGATFWLMNNSDGIPNDAFAGFGNRGQFLVIIPSRNLIIVRRGYDTRDNRFDIAAFTRVVVEATGS
ncbi:MAG: serine hydrolase domain-containing protein, partial [Pseudomonadota bacterium]